jgi:hypothetical protein
VVQITQFGSQEKTKKDFDLKAGNYFGFTAMSAPGRWRPQHVFTFFELPFPITGPPRVPSFKLQQQSSVWPAALIDAAINIS